MKNNTIVLNCSKLINAYKKGELGYSIMPEEAQPKSFINHESKLLFFTLPMSLNYQRDSYKLWEAAQKTYSDKNTSIVFNIQKVSKMDEKILQKNLLKYKLALQPNKHINTWKKISTTIFENWGTLENLFEYCNYDFLVLKDIIQKKYKKEFPYLSGPKIFNYWSYIIQIYGGIKLKNSQYIEIAPDTHITKCSIILGVITKEEALSLNKEQISEKWRNVLKGTGINPIDMHSPLWFWSRNDFQYKL